ncbi:signal transduction protein [Ignicoccus pacificus DSM 13166]|uniref:Signal transduction protein n=1 Tax=Ignicoccus pacificus DSM 13166 TaxID=940294 RepID=A0A977PKP0_9CREN|nr:signal transduction protein [Ignicoccus pacificus DSM 13166]
MRAADLIKRPPISCFPSTSLKEVIKIMRNNNVGSVMIVDGGKLLGIFTERDLVKALDEGAKLEEPISKYMNPSPITAKADESLESVVRKMLNNGLRHIPVVDSEGNVLGVISIKDIVETLYEGCNPP